MTGIPFTKEERQALLAEYFPAYRSWQALDYRLAIAGKSLPADLVQKLDVLDSTLIDLRQRYSEGLPFLPISRCPFTNQVVYHSLDPFGIDGLWWNYEAPVRPVESFPPTVHSITGALHINGEVGPVPFLCVPGPGVPYVLPEILSHDDVTAVLSSLPIGNHTGYVILYFTRSSGIGIPRANNWGMDHWELPGTGGSLEWGEGISGVQQADFNLAPWIEKKKLLWIAKDDGACALHSGTAGCPYSGLDGPRALQRVRAGAVELEEMEE